MANLCGGVVRTTTLLIVGTLVIGVVTSESFHFPAFVAIEGGDPNGAAVSSCGGWIIDKPLRPYVLTTEACVRRRGHQASLRQLLVRYGSAEVTSRTASLAVDRLLQHPSGEERLVVLSTFGRVRRQPALVDPVEQHHNGTALLCWRRTAGTDVLQKSLLFVMADERRSVQQLASGLLCVTTHDYLLEGALVLQNLTPQAMLTVPLNVTAACGTSLELLELSDLATPRGLARMIDSPLVEPAPDDRFTFTEPNSPFGYIVYVIFLGYCILYTLLFFIFGLSRTAPSTDL
uniref:Peptidase S1 domain-containing protein n=1 Tax=Anopheles dirus TaxID=7168 RepID=A0A182MXP2_9DIPT